MSDAISTPSKQICECCRKPKVCRMYVIPTGDTAWVCAQCRKGS